MASELKVFALVQTRERPCLEHHVPCCLRYRKLEVDVNTLNDGFRVAHSGVTYFRGP